MVAFAAAAVGRRGRDAFASIEVKSRSLAGQEDIIPVRPPPGDSVFSSDSLPECGALLKCLPIGNVKELEKCADESRPGR